LDILCVADMLTWHSVKQHPLAVPTESSREGQAHGVAAILGADASVMTGYQRFGPKPGGQLPFAAIGEMIPFLLMRLAWEDPVLREFALHFESIFAQGVGEAQMRTWSPADVYTAPVLEA